MRLPDVSRARSVEPTPIAESERSTIPYLFPSRYCQSDRLGRLAWDLFGTIENPHEKVVAIADWIHDNVEYLRGSTDSMTSAYDTVTQRTGVCRDFSHLGIALCRALNIPARYFSGYAYELEPPDFHACFECFIGGSWVVFDATRLAHLNGLVRIGTAATPRMPRWRASSAAPHARACKVSCQLGEGQKFVPIGRKQLNKRRRRPGTCRLTLRAMRLHIEHTTTLPLRAAGHVRPSSSGAPTA